MINATIEQLQLLNLLGHSLFGAPLEIIPEVDWNGVAKESLSQAVLTIAFNNYRNLPLSDELAAKMKRNLMRHVLNNVECIKRHGYLHELMQKNGINYCVLKGATSAFYYPDMMLRPMGDVDFYVAPDQFDRALQIFLDEHFTPSEDNHGFHIGLDGDKGNFELHFKPVGYREGELGELYMRAWENIIEDSRLCNTEIASFRAPSAFHHGFILLTHLYGHLISSGVGLRHLLDWAVFANSLSDVQFKETFETKFKEFGVWKLAQLLALAAVRNMGMPYKSWMGDDAETADELLMDILSGGNFGRKDKQRGYESALISRDIGNMENNRLNNLFKWSLRVVDSHWSVAKKLPFLYPFGWIIFGTRFFVRWLFGKRHLDVVSAYKKGKDRGDLYERMSVFTPEK